MQTHEDLNHNAGEFLKDLKARAAKMRHKESVIAGGAKGEEELASWKGSNGMAVRHLPPDPQGIARISIGGGDELPLRLDYCTIRGGVGECISLLERAIVALRECPG